MSMARLLPHKLQPDSLSPLVSVSFVVDMSKGGLSSCSSPLSPGVTGLIRLAAATLTVLSADLRAPVAVVWCGGGLVPSAHRHALSRRHGRPTSETVHAWRMQRCLCSDKTRTAGIPVRRGTTSSFPLMVSSYLWAMLQKYIGGLTRWSTIPSLSERQSPKRGRSVGCFFFFFLESMTVSLLSNRSWSTTTQLCLESSSSAQDTKSKAKQCDLSATKPHPASQMR
ncbi:hypothetical protein OPV22_024226 [Ensete ventricosum]|uniref:Uncharacterized protein n=1 Tax=Ensete ventricosum TaxID=4639 RepID=A0AAV8QJV4_ENSVE|nr:hypothetical protein OPV22_024226 [Ensete ventricosum]RWW29703.1 hypothetical protein GW17_00005769 [Ensete ventricosum]RWW40366.1 hypothetical protein BHE74_00054222 [Ensete ventricosum]